MTTAEHRFSSVIIPARLFACPVRNADVLANIENRI